MASGTLSNVGQNEWLAVALTADQAYEFTISGLSSDAKVDIGTVAGLAGDGIAASAVPVSDAGLVSGSTLKLYVSNSFATVPESYTVSAATTTADFTDNTTHPGSVAVGGSTTGTLSNVGQHDWIAVTLTADHDEGAVPSSTLKLYVSNSFATVPESYTASAATTTADYTDNTTHPGSVAVGRRTTGTLSNVGQHDWIAVTLTADQAYEFTISGLSSDAEVDIGTAAGLAGDGIAASAVPVSDAGIAPGSTLKLYFMPSASGTYYIDISDAFATVPESYTVSAATTTADYTDNTTHPGSVAVGGSTSGTLSNVGQHDWIAVTLTADQAYEFTISGLSSDAEVDIGTAAGLAGDGIAASAVPVSDAGIAPGSTLKLYFMPSASGTYYIDISDAFATVPESYTVSAATTTADYTDNTTHPGSVAVGGSTSGTLSNVGQHDWIAVTLTADQAYEFTISGLSSDAEVDIGTAAGLAGDGIAASAVPVSDAGIAPGSTLKLYFMPSASGTLTAGAIQSSNALGPKGRLFAAKPKFTLRRATPASSHPATSSFGGPTMTAKLRTDLAAGRLPSGTPIEAVQCERSRATR